MTDTTKLPPLPLGSSDFENVREAGCLYVDKTELIFDLISSQNRFIALSAPRRFGKSLTLSTIGSVFEHGTQYCQGLAIEKLWTEKTYPTVRLDFSGFENTTNLEDFQRRFRKRLKNHFGQCGFKAPKDFDDFYEDFLFWLHNLPNDSLVVLIDEYDRPLTQFVDDPELFKAVQAELSTFYSTLKINNKALRLLFITGVTRFAHTGLNEAANFITDISLNPHYASLLGFTHEELDSNFAEYIDQTARKLLLNNNELLAKLKDHYWGFCLDNRAKTKIYNPWDILNFFCNSPYFDSYWYRSGGSQTAILRKLFARLYCTLADFNQPLFSREDGIILPNTLGQIAPARILQDTGYLTISKALPSGYLEISYPNRAIRESLQPIFLAVITKADFIAYDQPLREHLSEGNIDESIAYLNSAVASLDYPSYAIGDQYDFLTFTQIVMWGNNLAPTTEQHGLSKDQSLGQRQTPKCTDIELTYGNFHYVFELKYADEETNPDHKLAEAVQQINDNRYGAHVYGKTLKRIALVFSAKTKSVYYQEVTSDMDECCN